jgi:4-amino-4-deoxy-L-arabinose transferase-like glycosyltransferase
MYFTQVKDSTRSAAIALLIALAATRIAIAFAHPYSLADNGIYQDDAFYFLQIARSWVEGRGLSFDASGPTSGFQPLYQLLLLPLVAISGEGPFMAVRASMLLLAAWAVATGALAFSLGRRLAGPGAGLAALGIFAFTPYFIVYSGDGQATGLGMFFALALARVHLWLFQDGLQRGRSGVVGYGMLAGLAVLARLDLAFLVAALGFDELLRLRNRDEALVRSRALLLAAIAAFSVWLPWAAYSQHYSGSFLPLSGAASREIALNLGWYEMDHVWSDPESSQVFDPKHPPVGFYADTVTKLGATALMELPLLSPLRFGVPFFPWTGVRPYPPHRFYLQHPGIVTIAAAVSLAGLVYLLLRRRTRQGLGLALLLYSVLMTFGYGVAVPVHWFYARYLAPILLLTSVVGVSAVARLLEPLPSRRRHALAALVLIVTMAGPLRDLGFFGRLSFAAEAPPSPIPAALERIQSRLPPGAHLGMFQAGAVSWFSGGGVMNLDGKVNNAAYEALADGRLHEYILASGVTHIHAWEFVLERLSLRHVPQANWHLERIDPGANSYDPTLFRITTP